MGKFVETRVMETGNFRREKTDSGFGTRKVPDGIIKSEVTVEIDIDAIFRYMGARALSSAGGKSVDGYVVVKCAKREYIGRLDTKANGEK